MSSLNYQLLVENDTAVLSICGALEQWTVAAMLHHCRALPAHVMTLRIDLRALGIMTAEAMSAVRQLLSAWRESSAGCFQLSTSYLVATCRKLNTRADLLRTTRIALATPVRNAH
jgi:ABC-type transporter Mla MlaB component